MKELKAFVIILLIGLVLGDSANAQDKDRAFSVTGLEAEIYAYPFGGGMNASQFGELDLDLDGTKDLIAFDRHGNRLMTFINNGATGIIDYSYAPDYINELPEFFHWVIFVDYNMDGKNDIFTYNPQYPGIIVYKNTSTTELRFELVVYPYLTSWYGSGYVNILVTYADYPGISDIDGDGDLDILSFWALGSFVEMHTNLSMETYGHADSLIFERTTSCWGYFAESDESNELFLDTCIANKSQANAMFGGERHTGSTMLLTDLDNDNTKDLLLGDVDYPQLKYLVNEGSSDEAIIGYYQDNFPDEENPTEIFSMPVPALIDVNNDGNQDLLASPFDPNPFVTQNFKSVWLYINEGGDEIASFNLDTKQFLQKDMIDLGSGAYPAFADINLDGLQDLIIGNWGYYDSSWYDEYMILHSDYSSRMAIFMNVGEPNSAQFEYITDDFGFINEMDILGTYPTFGDIDTDDDADMIVGQEDGTLLFYRNCSCLGNPEDFQLEFENYQGIDVGDYSTPCLYDIDEDGLVDLIIGEKAGNLNYYRNTGDIYEPVFTFITDSLGKINVTDPGLSWVGYSTPYMFRDGNGMMGLISGSEQGITYYYTNIEDNLEGAFELSDELWKEVDSTEFNIHNGYRTSAAIADLNSDGYLDMMVGNWSGGVELYSTELDPPVTMDIEEPTGYAGKSLYIFPNPAGNQIHVNIEDADISGEFILRVLDIRGTIIMEEPVSGNSQNSIDVSSLPDGLYICTVSMPGSGYHVAASKLIIQH